MHSLKSEKIGHITYAVLALVICLFVSCQEEDNSIDMGVPSANLPTMKAFNVNTVVSDSGVTRFRAVTKEWLVFQKCENPYWEFPKGVHLERFTPDMKVEANIDCDSAHYDMNKKLWELDGHVNIKNMKGETFDTEQLFWDSNTGRVYSNKLINIKQKTCIIKGTGFESNQSMTQYTISHPEGIIPVNE